MYLHRNCISTINRQMPKVIKNNGRKVCSINVYNRFIFNIAYPVDGAKVVKKRYDR